MPILNPLAKPTLPREGNDAWTMEWETDSSDKLHLLVESTPPS